MSDVKNTETEKKFLIKYPSAELFSSVRDEDRSFIVQTYLLSEKGVTSRVRSRKYADKTIYTKTEKRRVSDMTCFEDEWEISEEEYLLELKNADPERRPIEKERVLLYNGAHVFEVDIYPFWSDKAIMEVELGSEDEKFTIPQGIEVISDVTSDKRYKNAALAKSIPQ